MTDTTNNKAIASQVQNYGKENVVLPDVATKTTETKAPKAKDFKSYATKAPTNLHVHYAAWMQDKTGLDLPVDDDVVAKITQLAVSLYHDYQASDENKARREAEQATKDAASPKATKTPEQIQAAIAKLQAQLDAAKATPVTGAPVASATGEASKKPVGRKTAVAK